jgi:hypothetical protein
MSSDERNNEVDERNAADDGVEDLSASLGGGDESFIIPEKKQANRTSIVVFAIAMVGLGGWYLMYLKSGPNAAAASAEAVAADKTITQFLKAGDRNIKDMQDLLRNTEKEVEKFRAYPNVKQVPLSDLKTNPFVHVVASAAPGADSAADAKRRAEEKAAALKEAQTLQLQSIVVSDKARACMISNSLYHEGQQVGAFTIEKITPGMVVVANGTSKFELKIQK